ncbi:MAG: cadmium-translocating P-type ATPase [Euryarchaeota archaeon]|nr:cadmium-translocating P-type ATPase [Euryarchaeota archaeon]
MHGSERHDACGEESCGVCGTGEHAHEHGGNAKLIIPAGGVLLLLGLYLEFFTQQKLLSQLLFLAVVAVAGRGIIRSGVASALQRKLNINFLITLAAVGAFLTGHGEEGAAVVYLFFIAEYLEEYASARAKRSIAELMKLAPEKATVKRNGEEVEVHVHAVEVGDVVVVKPGDRIPLDGVVVSGASSVNQAPITGESMPVPKREGDEVYAGTINLEGYLEIRVSRRSEETLLSKIVKLVEQAQREKSRTEAFIDRFARYYTPAVIVLAVLVSTLPPLLFDQPFREWVYRGLVLLVISCPCALAISTPVSMVSAITSAARNGVLIKGGSYIEEIKHARVVVFDKTGTLTTGMPEVTDVVALNGTGEAELLRIAASLEAKARHPLARAIVAAAEQRGVPLAEVSEFRALPGRGIEGEIQGKRYFVGSGLFLKERGLSPPEELVSRLEREGKSVVMVSSDGTVIGVIALRDRLRDSALETVRELKRRGIRVVMLTGDNRSAAKAVAATLGVDEYHAELLPQDKVRIVEELLRRYEHVVMVGDGVNDAPALAKAHVGIAMGAIGSDVAIESADIALMEDDLSRITYLLHLSEKTMSVVRQNVAASILIKGSFAVLAFPGYITLWLAVAVGDMGLSLAVILNALRIGRVS